MPVSNYDTLFWAFPTDLVSFSIFFPLLSLSSVHPNSRSRVDPFVPHSMVIKKLKYCEFSFKIRNILFFVGLLGKKWYHHRHWVYNWFIINLRYILFLYQIPNSKFVVCNHPTKNWQNNSVKLFICIFIPFNILKKRVAHFSIPLSQESGFNQKIELRLIWVS